MFRFFLKIVVILIIIDFFILPTFRGGVNQIRSWHWWMFP